MREKRNKEKVKRKSFQLLLASRVFISKIKSHLSFSYESYLLVYSLCFYFLLIKIDIIYTVYSSYMDDEYGLFAYLLGCFYNKIVNANVKSRKSSSIYDVSECVCCVCVGQSSLFSFYFLSGFVLYRRTKYCA